MENDPLKEFFYKQNFLLRCVLEKQSTKPLSSIENLANRFLLDEMSVWNLQESALYEGMTENRGKIKVTVNNDMNKYFEIILAELFTSQRSLDLV